VIPAAFRLHARLLREPWGAFLPHQVADLDERQVVELYLKPAAADAERLKAQTATPGGRTADQEPTWGWFLAAWGSQYRGKTLDELREKFDRLHAAWVKEQKKKQGG